MAKTRKKATKASAKKASSKKTSKKAPARAASGRATSGKTAPAKAAKTSAKTAAKTAVQYRLNVGDSVPNFRAPSTSGAEVSRSSLAGRTAVIYFYPKDNTPGCTLEGHDFRRLHSAFQRAGATIYGVSGDSLKSHENFREKCGFPFELLSDSDGSMGRAFDVIQTKSMYGRTFEGIERSTFVVDGSGRVAGVWRKVKVDGHAQAVLEFVQGLKG